MLIEVDSVSKKFSRNLRLSIKYGFRDALRRTVGLNPGGGSLRPGEFWALRDISFSLDRGDRLAVLGRNGAGKTTLMRVLSGVLLPDTGGIRVNGEIDQILEITSGFHPMMTGYQNARLRARIAGFSERDFVQKLEEILEFTDLHDSIHQPVRFYSSGMKARLGFALSTMRRPDVLVIDEALAVGDLDFRLKCYEFIANYLNETALVFVSHSLSHIKRFCNQAMVLDKGRCQFYGDVQEAIELYQANNSGVGDTARAAGLNPEKLVFDLVGPNGAVDGESAVRFGEELMIRIRRAELPDDALISANLADTTGRALLEWRLPQTPADSVNGTATYGLGRVRLVAGYYKMNVTAHGSDGYSLLSYTPWLSFRVQGEMAGHAPIVMDAISRDQPDEDHETYSREAKNG